jgi:outer membrane protein assembly factor BamD (BamD/ComL family)
MGKIRKLSNQELRAAIKRNELEEGMNEAGAWIKAHLENVLIAAILLVVLAVLVPYWLSSRQEQNTQSAAQLRAAQMDYQRALSTGQAEGLRQARSKYQAVATSFAGSPAAAQASLGACQADLALGEYDQAMANFQGFLAEFGENHELAPLAVAGMGQVLEAKGEYAQAAERYLSIEGRQPPAPNLGVVMLDAVRCLRKAGQAGKAKEVLVRVQGAQDTLGLPPRMVAQAAAGLN